MYISELAPTQLKGALVNCYTLLFVVGQLMSAVALFELNAKNPLNFRDAIFTQWGMIGGLAIIFFLLPESPWWLVQVGRPEQAQKVLEKYNGGVPGYDAAQQVRIMVATVEEESRQNVEKDNIGTFAILKGTNGYVSLWAEAMPEHGLTAFASSLRSVSSSPACPRFSSNSSASRSSTRTLPTFSSWLAPRTLSSSPSSSAAANLPRCSSPSPLSTRSADVR